jgi:hypothetical protein
MAGATINNTRYGSYFKQRRAGFIVTDSRLEAEGVSKTYNGRAEIENRIKEWKNTRKWDKTNGHHFAVNQASRSFHKYRDNGN